MISAFVILFVLSNTIPRWIQGIDGDWFCKWQALSYLFLCIAATFKNRTKVDSEIITWALLLVVNNVYDEWIGDAKHLGTFEISFAILVTTWTVYRITKCQTKHKH